MTLLDWASDYKIESQPPTSKSNKSKTFRDLVESVDRANFIIYC